MLFVYLSACAHTALGITVDSPHDHCMNVNYMLHSVWYCREGLHDQMEALHAAVV
jgi:hypothetical protein